MVSYSCHFALILLCHFKGSKSKFPNTPSYIHQLTLSLSHSPFIPLSPFLSLILSKTRMYSENVSRASFAWPCTVSFYFENCQLNFKIYYVFCGGIEYAHTKKAVLINSEPSIFARCSDFTTISLKKKKTPTSTRHKHNLCVCVCVYSMCGTPNTRLQPSHAYHSTMY